MRTANNRPAAHFARDYVQGVNALVINKHGRSSPILFRL